MVEVPRNFRLLEEYDAAIGKELKSFIKDKHEGLIHYGLDEEIEDNILLNYWHASIIGPQGTQLGETIYNLKIYVPENYPQAPPQIRFTNPRINMPAVNSQGEVNLARLT